MNTEQKKIRILYLIDFLYSFGGTERHLFQLATRLDKDKFDSVIAPLRSGEDFIKIFRDAGLQVKPIPVTRIYGLSGIKRGIELIKYLRRERFDIVQTFNRDSDIYGTIAAKLAGVPVVISSRRDLGEYRTKRHLLPLKFINRYVDWFISVCDAAATQLSKMEGIDKNKISTIYNGFEISNLAAVGMDNIVKIKKEMSISPDNFVIGNVSHFRPEKGHNIFFDAVRRLKKDIPELRVISVGGGEPLLARYQEEIEKGELKDIVHFRGYVSNVLENISLMDVCCLTPVSNEGFSNALLEQMAMGKAIIVTDIGGNAEAIEHMQSGIIIPPNNVDALVDAVRLLYRDPELREKLSQNARLRVELRFDMHTMIRKMEDIYNKLYYKKAHVELFHAESQTEVYA